MQLTLGLAVPDPELAEVVGLGGVRVAHAVPLTDAMARRLGIEGWPTRACCGVVVRPGDVGGGTDDPDDISCQACLRALRRAGLLK